MKRSSLLLLLPLPYAAAQEAASTPARVDVKGMAQQGEVAASRRVVGRAAIAAYGDSSLADVLKREGGIAIVGNEVRMRGLGAGYTQILVDGEPVAQGFTIDSIAPELVERIEIARSPTADRSAQAVAGSINIVLRKRTGGARREDKAASGYQRGQWSPSASTQASGKRGNLAWSAGATLDSTVRIDAVRTGETVESASARLQARRFSEALRTRSNRLNLAPRLNWTFENGDPLGWNALAGLVRAHSSMDQHEQTLLGEPTAYPDSSAASSAHTASLRSSPILQLLWKLPQKNQLRLALARTYKAPLTSNLVPRRYTINNNNNGPANPDAEGNPALRPELSWGLDAAWERPLGKDGSATLSGYAKRVSDVMTQQLYRDGASWVARPINNGEAALAGIELDLKSPVRIKALAFDLRFNAARNWSRVKNVPGPDNTLAEQLPFTVNAGIDYRGAHGGDAGANLNVRGAATSSTGDGVINHLGRTALLDLYWTRKFDAQWRARVSVANALHRPRQASTTYRDADGSVVTRALSWDGMASIRIGFERTL